MTGREGIRRDHFKDGERGPGMESTNPHAGGERPQAREFSTAKDGFGMLQLYNTMSRRKERFEPRNEGAVKMFSCGPSIYGRPHVGNYRSFLWEDVLQRYLEHLGFTVERALSLTDVEDKAISEAQKAGTTVLELTDRNTRLFFEEAGALRIKLPSLVPRSSTTVEQAVRLILLLLSKGIAYWHEGDVFFDPLQVKGFGRLFRLDMSKWPKAKRRFKQDTYPGRRWNLGDFVLWHGYRQGDPLYWDTPIGKGRPAWNIQDPAMITRHLGYTIDIACGGVDNLYRHHDYNLAVIEAISGEEFSRYWIHGEHLLVDGKKMSKSVGNILYPEDLLKEGAEHRHIRFYLIYGNHRKTINLTMDRFKTLSRKLDDLTEVLGEIGCTGEAGGTAPDKSPGAAKKLVDGLLPGFEKHMNDDLNVKGAFDFLYKSLQELAALNRQGKLGGTECRRIEEELRKADRVLRVIFAD
ncbi:class I tRNA ligase family protein [Syntrophobacter fumaroxidans]|nr:class I tRNA ligase family protein [Syntrophobacter fumaroxidans]